MSTISQDIDSQSLIEEPASVLSAEDSEQPRYSKRDTILTMIGVLLVMLLASLDQTIVSTAMPHIISDLRGFNEYTWVSTAYLLTSTVMVPIYGKLSDLFGRKSIFLVGVTIFLIGSAASGAAQTMNQLIAFRAFQGLGAAALLPIAIAVIGDLFAPRERAKWQGVTGAVFGLSSILGPTAGGWITEHSTWRWVFYVNLPIGVVALLVLIFLMPTLKRAGKRVSIDYIGAALLIAGTVPLLLGFTWGGTTYAWDSVQIIGIFVGSVIVLAAFIVYEAYLMRKGAEPIINPSLFKNRIFTVSILVTMITSMGMYGSIFFLPLYAQGVLGISATNSGLLLAPMMLGLIISSVVSGQLVSRFGKYKWIAIIGMLVTICGSLLLLRLGINSTSTDMTVAMIVLGFGLGFSMSLYSVIVQNALPNNIGESTSALTFFRSIGATIALAALGSAMTSAYQPAFHDAFNSAKPTLSAPLQVGLQNPLFSKGLSGIASALDNPNVLLSQDAQTQLHVALGKLVSNFGPQSKPLSIELYNTLMGSVKSGLTQGIHDVFLTSGLLMVLGLIVVFFLKEIPLRGGKKKPNADEVIEEAADGVDGMSPVAFH